MISLQIKDVKTFMNKLFLSSYFDAFLVSEATFVTFSTFHIDGTLNKEFYSAEEREEQQLDTQTHSLWRQLRPFCLELIKGTHTPLEFRIVFRLSAANTEKLLKQGDLGLSLSEISGLFLNVHFQTGSLTCTTGTALQIFTLDRSLDQFWDKNVQKYLSIFVSTQLD